MFNLQIFKKSLQLLQIELAQIYAVLQKSLYVLDRYKCHNLGAFFSSHAIYIYWGMYGYLSRGRPAPTPCVPGWRIGERLLDIGARGCPKRPSRTNWRQLLRMRWGGQAVLLPSRSTLCIQRRSYQASRGAFKPLPLLQRRFGTALPQKDWLRRTALQEGGLQQECFGTLHRAQ